MIAPKEELNFYCWASRLLCSDVPLYSSVLVHIIMVWQCMKKHEITGLNCVPDVKLVQNKYSNVIYIEHSRCECIK